MGRDRSARVSAVGRRANFTAPLVAGAVAPLLEILSIGLTLCGVLCCDYRMGIAFLSVTWRQLD
jgi:hypothetical protein